MSDRSPTILILGAEVPSRGREADTLGSNPVPVETLRANLKALVESLNDLFVTTGGRVGALRICHVDVAVAIGADGSMGLVGTGAGAGTEATLKLRLKKIAPADPALKW